MRFPGTQFRWFVEDDHAIGDHWTNWHTVAEPCTACCCDGPDEDGAHQDRVDYYDEDGILMSGHIFCDPNDIEDWDVEWRTQEERT